MTDTARPETCPSCGATVRNDVPWCLQCYADLRAQPEPEPLAQSQPVPSDAASAASQASAGTGAAALDPAEAERLADELVAKLARQDREVPSWQGMLPTSSSGKALVAIGAVLVAGVVVLLALTLLGMLV